MERSSPIVHRLQRSILPFALALLGFTATASATSEQRAERACAGLSEADRGRALFGDRLEVLSSRALRPRGAKPIERGARGAEVFVRAEPGLTARYVHRLAACHIALYEASVASSGEDPLAVEGAEIRVRERGAGFVLQISADRRSAASAIIERASALPGRTVSRSVRDRS
jgi:hypothetical protein